MTLPPMPIGLVACERVVNSCTTVEERRFQRRVSLRRPTSALAPVAAAFSGLLRLETKHWLKSLPKVWGDFVERAQ